MRSMRRLVLSRIASIFGLLPASGLATPQEAKLPRVGVLLLGSASRTLWWPGADAAAQSTITRETGHLKLSHFV